MTWELARHILAGAALTIGAFGLACAAIVIFQRITGRLS